MHLIPSHNAFFDVINESNVELRKSESILLGRRENKHVSNIEVGAVESTLTAIDVLQDAPDRALLGYR